MKYHYLKMNIDNETLKKKLIGFDLQVKELMYDDFCLGCKDLLSSNRLENMKMLFDDPTYKIYAITENDKICCFCWISLQYLPFSGRTLNLNVNEGYVFDGFCFPDSRGKGLFNLMILICLHELYLLGKNQAIVIILDGNIPSMKSQINAGFIDLGCLYTIKLFGISFISFKKNKLDQIFNRLY